MPISVVMPALEMAQETGKLIAWLKKEGDRVSKGEPLLEIETDKAIMEIESPGEGVLGGVKAEAGAEIPVGQTIAWILRPGENVPIDQPVSQSGRHKEHPSSQAVPVTTEVAAKSVAQIKVSPKARRLARELKVDLTGVRGSGAGGEILASDIEAAAGAPAKQQLPAAQTSTDSLSTIARLMAERTTQSWTSVPHFFVVREVDAGALNGVRVQIAAAFENKQSLRITHTDLLIALLARVLARHPRVNASWTGDGIHNNADVNIGLAMAVEDGVVAPVIPGADRLDLGQIAAQRKDLTERARAGKLRPADLAGGTFTISNLGMYNVDAFTAIIIPPQAAILAVGRIADRVVPFEGKPAIRPMLTLTLSADHRVIDGARAALFLDELVQAMLVPGKWLEL
jgi:pyruvate dehydrogenase E2 component (dihydrolipoyllysine-residue acetyltransferase)